MCWLEMDYTIDISDQYWILDGDANAVLLNTIFLQLVSNSTISVSTFCPPPQKKKK